MSQPAHKIRDGGLALVIWRNTSTSGQTCYTVNPKRLYTARWGRGPLRSDLVKRHERRSGPIVVRGNVWDRLFQRGTEGMRAVRQAAAKKSDTDGNGTSSERRPGVRYDDPRHAGRNVYARVET
jgi:hypothetical protein